MNIILLCTWALTPTSAIRSKRARYNQTVRTPHVIVTCKNVSSMQNASAREMMAKSLPDGSSHYNSETFPRRGRAVIGGASTCVHRDDRTSSAVTNRAVSQNPSALEAQGMTLTRSKSLQDLREELVRTSRSALEKWEESQLAVHRSALLREIQVRTQSALTAAAAAESRVQWPACSARLQTAANAVIVSPWDAIACTALHSRDVHHLTSHWARV